MDVEDIKRINQLAQNLLTQGLASSREDAVRQAENMLNKKLSDASGPVSSVSKDEIETYKNIIERTKYYMDNQLKSFKTEIEVLRSEVFALKDQLANVKSFLSSRTVEKPKETQGKLVEEKKAQESHPRMGNYSPSDVSVEKMFYFGRK